MTARRPLLLFTALLLAGCSALPAPTSAPKRVPQGTPEVVIVFTPKSPVASVVDDVATKTALLDRLQVAQQESAAQRDEISTLRQQITDLNNRGLEIAADIRRSEENTARYNAAQGPSIAAAALAKAIEETARARQKEADNERLRLAARLKDVEKELADIQFRQFLIFAFVAIFIVACLFAVHRLDTRTKEAEAIIAALEMARIAPLKTKILERNPETGALNLDTTPPGDPDKFTVYCVYALGGGALGINAVVEGAKIYSSHAEYKLVHDWMAKNERLAYVPTEDGQKKSLSDAGEIYCKQWVSDHPAPLPALVDVPEVEQFPS